MFSPDGLQVGSLSASGQVVEINICTHNSNKQHRAEAVEEQLFAPFPENKTGNRGSRVSWSILGMEGATEKCEVF